jgi:hypothetical protein
VKCNAERCFPLHNQLNYSFIQSIVSFSLLMCFFSVSDSLLLSDYLYLQLLVELSEHIFIPNYKTVCHFISG